jgi:methylated-DNA-[protein]-cysteine S-methyltransferase
MRAERFQTRYESRFGTLTLLSDGESLTAVRFSSQADDSQLSADSTQLLQETCRQLDAFFSGELKKFELPLAPQIGTEFQQAVWHELRRVPYGTTITYTELARRVGRPAAVRAVGAANGRNPLPIVVPCHRVIGADGRLTGYAGGLHLKQTLLDLESGRLPASC